MAFERLAGRARRFCSSPASDHCSASGSTFAPGDELKSAPCTPNHALRTTGGQRRRPIDTAASSGRNFMFRQAHHVVYHSEQTSTQRCTSRLLVTCADWSSAGAFRANVRNNPYGVTIPIGGRAGLMTPLYSTRHTARQLDKSAFFGRSIKMARISSAPLPVRKSPYQTSKAPSKRG